MWSSYFYSSPKPCLTQQILSFETSHLFQRTSQIFATPCTISQFVAKTADTVIFPLSSWIIHWFFSLDAKMMMVYLSNSGVGLIMSFDIKSSRSSLRVGTYFTTLSCSLSLHSMAFEKPLCIRFMIQKNLGLLDTKGKKTQQYHSLFKTHLIIK